MQQTRRTLLLTLVCVAVATGCQSTGVKTQSPRTLRVLTYNIHHGEGTDKRFDYDRLAGVINGLRPDIVALQEVDCGTERASGADQAKRLARLCRMHYAFGQAMPHQGGQYGEAILSRFPIEKTVVHPLPYHSDFEPRAAVEVVIRPAGIGPLSFVGTHLCHRSEELRIQQTRRLSELFPSKDGNPVILAGDFNSRPGSEPMNVLLGAGWIDVVAPRSVIDYILVRACNAWAVKEVVIVDEPVASDHDPVLAVLEWSGDN
ncbi:MAG TPA: endonuclease/exonuclease/phosphatase family protein [Sedimentisphaerales bacterium]|jgi:endonuclease/exonuclease/phosphatase family metal-dependent hydrolase|nr:endonuclease/exonuclease/phosphatase family protein [Sedimentisphaerales bacterium]HNU30341.1 endonuclease/exonuclease/phosphatase family protein [Sedimentisphaerales bacterium]